MGLDLLDAFKSYTVPLSYIIVFFLVLAVLVVLGVRFYLKNKKLEQEGKIKMSVWRYKNLLTKKHFTLEDIDLIDDICKKYDLKEKGKYLMDREVFNRLSKKYMAEHIVHLSHDEQEVNLRLLSNIREKCHFDKVKTGSSLYSTHELESNLNVTIQCQNEIMQTVVLDNLEPYFVVSMPDDAPVIPDQSAVQVSFWRAKDGHYNINTKILKSLPDPLYVYCLSHKNNIHLDYHRDFLRVNCNINCQFKSVRKSFIYFEDTAEVKKGKGVIINMSGGGLAVRTSKNLSKESYVSISFAITRSFVLKDVKGKVVDIEERGGEQMIYHISFIGLADRLLENIINHVETIHYMRKVETK